MNTDQKVKQELLITQQYNNANVEEKQETPWERFIRSTAVFLDSVES